MLILEGFLNGLSAFGVLLINSINGIYVYYKSKKLDAKLLSYAALVILCMGFLWLAPTIDFLTILITENNLNPYWVYPILSYMWVAPAIIFSMYIGTELLIPDKKRYVLSIYVILGVIFEIVLFLFPAESFIVTIPNPSGSNIIDTSHVYGSITFILIAIFLGSGFVFDGIGFLTKMFKAKEKIVKKKFLYMSIGFILFTLVAVFDSLIPPGPALPFVRFGIIISSLLLYAGLKT